MPNVHAKIGVFGVVKLLNAVSRIALHTCIVQCIATIYQYSGPEGHSRLHIKFGNINFGNERVSILEWPFSATVPFDCAKRLHIGDSNHESPIS